MFANSTITLMVMVVLFFTGVLIMFMFVIRAISEQTLHLKESLHQQQEMFLDIERMLREIAFSIRQGRFLSVSRVESLPEDTSALLGDLPEDAMQKLTKKFPPNSNAALPNGYSTSAPLKLKEDPATNTTTHGKNKTKRLEL